MIDLRQGDCLEVMRTLPDNSVHACVTDPPYGLAFMGKKWDYDVPAEDVWREVLRILKPGGFLLSFSGTRTYHRMTVRIEDAGFEIRDMIQWLYGSGFPKSHDVSKAIDREAGAEREVIGSWKPTGTARPSVSGSHSCAKTTADSGYEPDTEARVPITAPATDAAKQWEGWGTALKPACECVCVARKPLVGTVAQNVLAHGCGGLNIDGCRVGFASEDDKESAQALADLRAKGRRLGVLGEPGQGQSLAVAKTGDTRDGTEQSQQHPNGRWPANVVHDGSDEVLALFPQAGGGFGKRGAGRQMEGWGMGGDLETVGFGDSGSAARFFKEAQWTQEDVNFVRAFYSAKADRAEREKGVTNERKVGGSMTGAEYRPDRPTNHPTVRNHHPTVKPVDLMRWLVRLVCPPGGVVIDPYTGSGTTGVACRLEGFGFIGIELNPEYIELARQRINAETPSLFSEANIA